MQAKAAERYLTEKISLPTWSENKRGTPNSFLRSALFSAVQSKDRIDMKKVVLASQAGIIVTYTGQQLNQEDLTVWECLVHLAKDQPLGNICEFNAHEILKSINASVGGDQYEYLHDIIIRLTGGVVEIKHIGNTFFGSLIESGVRNDETRKYTIKLSRELIKLYGKTEWTAVNWDQRALLKRKPLALSLHGYYSSHKKPLPVKVETLMKFTGGNNKLIKSFKQKIKTALNDLIKIDFLEGYCISESNIVTVTKRLVVRDTKARR